MYISLCFMFFVRCDAGFFPAPVDFLLPVLSFSIFRQMAVVVGYVFSKTGRPLSLTKHYDSTRACPTRWSTGSGKNFAGAEPPEL